MCGNWHNCEEKNYEDRTLDGLTNQFGPQKQIHEPIHIIDN